MSKQHVTPRELVDQALEIVRTRSIKRSEIDWPTLAAKMLQQVDNVKTLDEAHEVIRALLARLDDGHSFLRTTGDMASTEEPRHSGMRLHQEVPVVIDVRPDGPAERVGIRIGDRIVRVGDEPVSPDNWRRLRKHALRAGSNLGVEKEEGTRELILANGVARTHPEPAGFITASQVGLLDLPGHDGDGTLGEGRSYGALLSELLHDLEHRGARAWIIDLRRCDGGNMWPLLAGLVPLLGVGRYGSFVDPVDDIWFDWAFDGQALTVINRSERSESYLMAEVPDWMPLRKQRSPVAVLTSAVTSSSGEAVLISFLGRDRTRTFGGPTGGLTTSNNLHVLLDGSWLLLAESLEADRKDNIYRGRIEPDETIEIDWRRLLTQEDPVIDAATHWLLQQVESS